MVADSVLRLKPGVLAEQKGYEEESYWDGLLEYPQYTRPEVWEGRAVPQVLLGGDHQKIDAWRGEQSRARTRLRRRSSMKSGVPPTHHRAAQMEAGREHAPCENRGADGCRRRLMLEGRRAVCAQNWTPEFCARLTEEEFLARLQQEKK